MFDVSFGELMVVAIVALVVIGPDKLPKVARTLGLLAGRMQRYAAAVKSDIERELQAQELQDVRSEVQQAVRAVEVTVKSELQQIEAPVAEAAQAVAHDGQELPHKLP